MRPSQTQSGKFWIVLVQRDQSGSHAEVILNYTGGAYIYIRREYASRIRIIQRSWKTANKQAEEEMEEARGVAHGAMGSFAGLEADSKHWQKQTGDRPLCC